MTRNDLAKQLPPPGAPLSWSKPAVRIIRIDDTGGDFVITFQAASEVSVRMPNSRGDSIESVKIRAEFALREMIALAFDRQIMGRA